MAKIDVNTTAQPLPNGAFTLRNEGEVNCRLGNTAADAATGEGMKLAPGEVFPRSGSLPLFIRCESGSCDVRIIY